VLREVLAHREGGEGGEGKSNMMEMFLLMMKMQQQSTDNLIKVIAARGEGGGNSGMVEKLLLTMLTQQKTPASEIFEIAQQLKRLSKGADKDDDEDDVPWYEKLGRAAAPFGEAIMSKIMMASEANGMPPGAPGPQAQLPEAAAPGAAPAATNGHPPTPPMNPMLTMMISRFRKAALEAADAKQDPKAFAQLLLNEVPPKYYPTLVEKADADDWFAVLFGADAKAESHRVWLTACRDAILAEFPEEEKEETAATTPAN